jgi:hypothetical protein
MNNKSLTLTKENLQKLIGQVLEETARKTLDAFYKAQKFLTDEEFDRFSDLRAAKRGGEKLSPQQQGELENLLRAVSARERQSLAGTDLDPEQVSQKAYDAKAKLMPPALKALGKEVPDEDSVDPFAKTMAAQTLSGPTAVVPKVKKENKILTLSKLQKIINEELLVILTNDEAKEMFDIDIEEESEK